MTLFNNRTSSKLFLIVHLVAVVMLAPETGYSAKNEDKDKNKDITYSMTEAEFQAQVMAFADRYSAVISSANREYLALSPSAENRRAIRSQLVYSMADAFTIAAGPNPDAALLDMVVMVTLGRMVFEQHYAKNYGNTVTPIVNGFQAAERDIWQIADRVLTKQQQKELMAMIKDWRRKHSDVVIFSYVRFSDFENSRGISDASSSKISGGLFQSVAQATQQVEEVRLLAERGMYLGSRLPLMTGAFADVWLSQWSANPDVNKTLTDIHKLSKVPTQLAEITEILPDNITAERKAAVKQVMQEANTLGQVVVDRVMQKVTEERKATVNQLIEQVAKERELTVKEIIGVIEHVEEKGKKWATYALILGIALIIIFLIGAVFAMLAYRYFSQRLFNTGQQ